MKIVNSKVDIEKVIELGLINPDTIDEEVENHSIEIYIRESLTDEDLENIIEQMDFRVCKDRDMYHLEDMQGANLGDIENDEFENLDEILNRLDVYMYDYGIIVMDLSMINQVQVKENNQSDDLNIGKTVKVIPLLDKTGGKTFRVMEYNGSDSHFNIALVDLESNTVNLLEEVAQLDMLKDYSEIPVSDYLIVVE